MNLKIYLLPDKDYREEAVSHRMKKAERERHNSD